jgi:hypothetical protein
LWRVVDLAWVTTTPGVRSDAPLFLPVVLACALFGLVWEFFCDGVAGFGSRATQQRRVRG